jgi:choline dehydrogenase-like flavoprotein
MAGDFSAIFVGTGFASSFFLSAYLRKAKATDRVLVLERGQLDTHAWRMQHRSYSSTAPEETFVNSSPEKRWYYTPAVGGGSNAWWAITPRLLPNDFKLRSVYGVGADWPITYEELEDFYYQVEAAMSVSGPDDGSPVPRTRPYPQPPHRFSDPDRLLKAAYPDLYFQQATARPRRSTANRPACCASGVCDLCPIDSKFTILNEMFRLYQDPRISLTLGAAVQTVETTGRVATGVTYLQEGRLQTA